MPLVLSLGSISADFEIRTDEPPSGPGAIEARELLRTSGGKAANVALLATRLGTPAALLAAVGNDDLAAQALAGPAAAGVDLSGVRRVEGPTGFTAIVVPPDGAKSIFRVANANDAWADEAGAVGERINALSDGSILVVDLEIPGAVVDAALEAAARRGVPIVLDPAPPARLSERWLSLVHHLTPDASEAGSLTGIAVEGEDEGLRAARDLRRRGAAAVHVKLPDGGCAVVWEDGEAILRAPDVDVVDQTGAGDAYAGGLAWALVAGLALPDAARMAVAASSCAVTAYGSQESYPDRARLERTAAAVELVLR